MNNNKDKEKNITQVVRSSHLGPEMPPYPYGPDNEGVLPTIEHKYGLKSLDLKKMIRNHAVGLLLGRGYILEGEDWKLIAEIIEKSGDIYFLMGLENCEFEYGHAIVNIHETKGEGLR